MQGWFYDARAKQPKELELLKQLIGEWTVGIALKTSEDKIVSGCGEMSAVEIADIGDKLRNRHSY